VFLQHILVTPLCLTVHYASDLISRTSFVVITAHCQNLLQTSGGGEICNCPYPRNNKLGKFWKMKSHLKNDGVIPPLVDLCLYVVCKNLNGCDYLNTLPDFLRQRMGMLFKQEHLFQDTIENLNFAHCSTLTDDELKNVSHLTNIKNLNLTHCDKLSAMGMCFVGQLQNLRVLRLSHCPKVSAGFYWLSSLVHLHRLEAAFCDKIQWFLS
jgi:hypothetical protein